MRAGIFFFAAIVLSGQNLMPPPYVRQGGVLNAASRMPGMLPGGALAPGALVTIDGLRFTPHDVAVEIKTTRRSYKAAILTATTDRILAQLPDFRETGIAKLFVLSRGQRSAGSDITLGTGAFGIFTANGKGWGGAASKQDAVGAGASLSLVHPGDEITLSGTGIGHTRINEIHIVAGDRTVARVRRSGTGGLDRLTFELPFNTPEGCAVPVAVRTPEATSNIATLSVSRGSDCVWSPPWFDRGSVGRKSGTIVLMRSDLTLELTRGKPVHFFVDNIAAGFAQRRKEDLPALFDLIPPVNTCIAFAANMNDNDLVLPSFVDQAMGGRDLDLGPSIAAQSEFLTDLDVGRALTVAGPAGSHIAERSIHPPHVYSALLGGDPPFSTIKPTPLFLTPGPYEVRIPGGPDIGALTIAMEAKNSLVWKNREQTVAIDRHAAVEVEWSAPAGYQAMIIVSNIDRRRSTAGFALCAAAPESTHFRVPSSALANLPATRMGDSDLSLGFIGILAIPVDPPKLNAPGLDAGRAIYASLNGRSVVVK